MSILAYMIKFEKIYFTFDMDILEGVLTYRLLNSANITYEWNYFRFDSFIFFATESIAINSL